MSPRLCWLGGPSGFTDCSGRHFSQKEDAMNDDEDEAIEDALV